MNFLIIYVTFIQLILTDKCTSWRIGQTKKWLPDLEWSTSQNWEDNSFPESKSRISFPLELFHSVGLPSDNLLVSGIELPRDGGLLLARDGSLQLVNTNNKLKIKKWKLKGPFYWADPDNWNSSSATPHLERIPCSMDTVILPDKNHSLNIRLPNTRVKVMELRIGERETIDEWRWKSMIHGREFKKSPISVSLSGLQYCGTDCLCKPDNVDLLDEICQIARPKCGRPGCEYPIQVEGHCCDYCGGRVIVSSKSLSIAALQEIAEEALENFYGSISLHTRASWDGEKSEVLIIENGIYSGIKSQEAVDKLTGVLMAHRIPIIYSETTGASMSGSVLATALGLFFGTPIILFILMLIALPYYGYSYNYIISIGREAFSSIRDGIRADGTPNTGSSFGFARFENLAEGDVQLARAITAENEMLEIDNEDNDNVGRGKRFENPLYRSRRKSSIIDNPKDTENIVNIDTPVSLSELQKKVFSSEDVSGDSD
ncbi:protein amnionless [Chelonus insularis]|uniref:protein amnionless n=1 Tax=Chelonus insularis TaxID=460826 RepID=UPI00158B4AE9|nr:protein amnionless [Chelonus insularis]